MKPIDSHGDAGSPDPGERGKGSLEGSRDELIVVHSDDDFDIDAVFSSEDAPAEPPLELPLEAPIEAPLAARAEPAPPVPHLPATPVPPPPATLVPPPPVPAASPAPAAPDHSKAAALSVADLLDNHVRLEWQEAVAIAQHLCELMSHEPGANVQRSLVEPWNVEITWAGEVFVLPGGSSSDPLVKQVGRVLRALLQDSIAPAELRLVASQASFEVPVYASVDELSAALKRFGRPGDDDAAIRAAFNRGLEAKLSALPAPERVQQVIRSRPAEAHSPVKRPPAAPTVGLAEKPGRSWVGMLAASAFVTVVVVAAAVLVMSRLTNPTEDVSVASTPAPELQRVEPVPVRPPAPPVTDRSTSAPASTPPSPTARTSVPDRPAPAPSGRSPRARDRPEPESAPVTSILRPAPPRSVEGAPRSAASPSETFEAAERRAGALLAEGRTGEAAAIFDGIVMKNPLYQLDPARSSPEALAVFQSSKRLLLPAMARRYFQEAKAAYDAGDYSLSVTKSERAQALLRDADIDPGEADLEDELTNLVAMATSARTLEESRIYTNADRDVTPPRPIGRQLSTASLSGRAPLTGRLQLVVGRSGEVETVRLDTPFNGYHDRMIVSAAKAWHYRPAMRKGRPVRYSMVMSFTLPDF